MVELSARGMLEKEVTQSSHKKNFTRHFEEQGIILSADFSLEQALDPKRWDEVQVTKLFVSTKKRA